MEHGSLVDAAFVPQDVGTATRGTELAKRLELVETIGQRLSAARDLDQLFRALYEGVARLVDATVFFLALYDEASQTVEVVRQVDRGVEHPGGSFPLGGGFTSEVIRSRTPRLVRRWSAEGPPIRVLYGTETGKLVPPESGLIVPLLFDERVVGVLSAQSYRAEAYDEADLLVLRVAATQAAAALEHLRRSERLAREQSRRASELETILASMTDALLIVDANGAIVRLNHAARELLTLGSASIVLGQPLERQRLELWPATAREIAEALAPTFEALRRGEAVAELEVELRAAERRTLSFSAAPIRDAQGPRGGVVVFRDVTGRHEVERLKEEMLATASHDLRTPVTVIKGEAELLLRRVRAADAPPEVVERAVASVVTHAGRLGELLDTILDLSCLEAGRLDVLPRHTELVALVREVAEAVGATTNRHRIAVRGADRVVGEWDGRRLQQVLTNLVTNAVKYSPHGGAIEISVKTDGRSATVCVRDEGLGLAAEELRQLFRRGYRGEAARGIEGRGFGLYISQGIVGAHGGRMWAESPGPGRGSSFWFALPLADDADTGTAVR